jgi:hypothetical protein
MKTENTKLLIEALKLVNKIRDEYNKIDFKSEFSTNHHDIMLYQKSGATEQYYELKHMLENNMITDKQVKDYFATFNDALKYMKSVIKIQEQINKLPDPIFG